MSSNALSHAYIVHSQESSGGHVSEFVRGLLSEMLCSSGTARPCGRCIHCEKISRGIHPDVAVIAKPDGKKDIVVDQIRDAVFDAALLPNEAERRVIVINEAEAMNFNAQNALLKLLEEPPSYVSLILITSEPGALLPTVRSRCRLIESGVQPSEPPADIVQQAGRYFELALTGGIALCEFSFELEKMMDKLDFVLFLSEVRRAAAAYIRQKLETGSAGQDALTKKARAIVLLANEADKYLDRNVSILHICALLCCSPAA